MKRNLLFILFFLITGNLVYAQQGTIRGKVTDLKTGEPMIGANVYLDSTAIGGSVDLDGNYEINNVPPGTYTLVASFITYATIEIQNVTVKANEVVVFNFQMEESATALREFEVTAKAVKNSENALLAMQKISVVVQDGISSQEINKTGAGNAAVSAKQITGTSVVDGKYVYVRGLGDRYTTAQLNGATLISTDPYINSAPLDLISSNLLDNMVVIKTATPNQPGNFSGGIVNIATKDFPEKMTLNYSYGISYNPQSSFNNNFQSYNGGKYDWFGYDDGTRALPSVLQDQNNLVLLSSPSYYIKARKNEEDAQLLNEASTSLNPQMEPNSGKSFTNYSTSFSFGNQYKLFKNPLGIILGINHSKNYSFYENGKNQAWDLTTATADELFTYYDLKDNNSAENPLVNVIAGISYKIGTNHEIGILNMYNHDTEKLSRYQSGKIPGILSGSDKIFETRTLQFKERGLNTTQLRGSHLFKNLHNVKFEWVGAYTTSFQNEPDLRFFANENVGDSLYYISVSEYDLPNHYFRYLNDISLEFKGDITIPLSKEEFNFNKIKLGFRTNKKDRNFEEYSFYYKKNNDADAYQGEQYAFFGPQNTGVIGYDPLYNRYIIGNYLINNTKISNNYFGQENITAFYAMTMLEITKKIKFTGGLRVRKNRDAC